MRILTFDIEEWFHILDHDTTRAESSWSRFPSRLEANVDRILTMLTDFKVSATFFCLGWIAEQYPNVVRRISEARYDIGSHSYAHQLAYELTPAQFRQDLHRSIATIENVTGTKVRSYRMPGFSLTASNTWTLDALIEEGIEIDCSVFPARRAHGGFQQLPASGPTLLRRPSGVIKELPVNVFWLAGIPTVFSGGGYFRLLPYFIHRWLFARSEYLMTYFHPRDFDPGQPMIRGLSPLRRFKSYYGLSRSEAKLRRLLAEFDFIDVKQAEASVNWSTVTQVSV